MPRGNTKAAFDASIESRRQDVVKRKAELLEELRKSMGIISVAVKNAKLTRQTFRNYMNEDPEFAEAYNDIKESTKDYAESALIKNISKGKETSIFYYLNSQAKDRGYGERKELDITTKGESLNEDQVYDKLSPELKKKVAAELYGIDPSLYEEDI